MTAATITQGNLILVDFQAARTVTVPRKRRAMWHWPWWWPTVLRARLIRCESNFDVLMGALGRYGAECPS